MRVDMMCRKRWATFALLLCTLSAAVVGIAQELPRQADSVAGEHPGSAATSKEPMFGVRLALLPLADVSSMNNGIHLDMTHDLAIELQSRGVEVVPEGDVLQFMADNRVRFSGYLDSLLARKLGREFDCDLVLLGTVTEIDEKRRPKIGVTLTVMDTEAGAPVWAATRAVSANGQVRLLGRGDQQTLEDLKQPLLHQLIDELQENLTIGRPKRQKSYQIISARVAPAYVRGGDVVDFRLEIRFVAAPPRQILLETPAGVVPLYPGQVEGLYLGHWVAPETAGHYPLALLFDWGRGGRAQHLPNIASYHVVTESPELKVSLTRGVKIGDVTAFRSSLVILPEMEKTTPIRHWELSIRTEEGVVILREAQDGPLPTKLVWQGTDAKGRRVRDGRYELAFDVWDAAGNHSGTRHRLAMKSATVPVQLSSIVQDGRTYLQLDQENAGIAPISHWSLKVASLSGETLLQTQGGFLPIRLELPYLVAETTLLCDIRVEDDLGNSLSLAGTRVKVEEGDAQIAKKADDNTDIWVEDF